MRITLQSERSAMSGSITSRKRPLAHCLGFPERFEQALREPGQSERGSQLEDNDHLGAAWSKRRRGSRWPEYLKLGQITEVPLPPAHYAVSKSFTSAKMAKAAAKTRKIDEMFSSATQKSGVGSSADAASDMTVDWESSRSSITAASSPAQALQSSHRCQPEKRPQPKHCSVAPCHVTQKHREAPHKPRSRPKKLKARSTYNPGKSIHQLTEVLQKTMQPSHGQINCKCAKTFDDPRGTIKCASLDCKIVTWHKGCGGKGIESLTKDHNPSHWRCPECRALKQATSPTQSTSDIWTSNIPVAEPYLHPEQFAVLNAVLQSQNVFCTGSAGTGKSTVLKAAVRGLRAQGKKVDILAPTGVAALAIGGCTIFRYAGWFPTSFKTGQAGLVKQAFGKAVLKRLCSSDVIVIDEISMLERDMLSMLDLIMREVRDGWQPERSGRLKSMHCKSLPFGGCQVAIFGDFCQLPPVKPFQYCLKCGGNELQGTQGATRTCGTCKGVYKDEDKWAFKSPAWNASAFKCFELKHIHRQKDTKFISILQKCRNGVPLSQAEQDMLQKPKANMDDAIKLVPTKEEANALNERNLRLLPGQSRTYTCWDDFDWQNRREEDLKLKGERVGPGSGTLKALKDHRFESESQLKVGSLVILLVNLDPHAGLVNGSQGRVIGFEKSDYRGHSRLDNLSEVAAFKEAQISKFVSTNTVKEWPAVLFSNGIKRTIMPVCAFSELGHEKPFSRLSRTMIPLLSAWAITVHKCQGLSLEKVEVDLWRSFEREQVYVALSRARSLEGLWVTRMPRSKGSGMNREVKAFLKESFGGR